MTAGTTTATPAAGPARAAELFTPRARGLTLGIVSTITLVALESLAIGTVMPTVARELGDLQLYGWVFSAFFLGNLIGIVVVGGALDRMPLRRPFAIGLGLFALGLLAGGLAPSMPVLVAARFVQGLGGGAIPPTAYVAVGRGLPERLRPPMFALMSTAWVVPGILGPTLAALVGQAAGWRWVFLGLLPFLGVAGVLALSALRGVPDRVPDAEHDAAASTRRRLPNALLVAGGTALLVAALTSSEAGLALGGSALGLIVLLPAFRRLTPPGTLVLARGLPAAVLLRGTLTFAFFAADAYIPLLLQAWRHTPTTLTGLVFTATTLAWTGGTWLQARRVERWGPRRFAALGFGVVVVGTVLTLPVFVPGVPPELSIVTWGVTGVGMGLGYSSFTLIVLRDAAPAAQGAASSALQLADVLGTSLGTGVAGAIVAAGERAGGDGMGVALGAAFTMCAAVAALGVVATRRLRPDAGRPMLRNAEAAALD